jgi:tetratricopeptide (TPR) repeat protein
MILAAQIPQDALAYLEQAALLDPSLDEPTQKLRQNIRLAVVQDEPAYTLVQSGRALAAMNEWDLASQAFSGATTLRPDYAEGWAYYAEALQHQGQENAQETYLILEKALELDPSSTAVQALLSLYWSRQGEDTRALKYMEQAVQLNPDSATFQMELGRLSALQGDLPRAQSAYERAVQLAPLDAYYQHMLVGFFLQYHLDIRQTALPIARQLVIDSPNDPASLDMMGQVLFSLKDHYGAMRFYERAISLNPKYVPSMLHMGSLLLYLGEDTQAQEYLRQAAEMAPQTSYGEQAERLTGFYFP